METKKVLTFIFSLLFVGAFTFVLCWGIINFNKVKDGMSGTGVYTQEDINKSYQDGYDTALTNKEEYDELINSYRDNITTLTDTISQLNSDKNGLQNNIRDYQTQVNNLTTLKNQNETLITNLTNQVNTNNANIDSLNSQIVSLNNQINNLTTSNEDNAEVITNLRNQITSLQNLSSQLQTTNELNLATIETLNLQVASLNTQISNISLQLQDNSNNVVVLNSRINELQNSIAYYENYIASLETGSQVIATFEFNGSVYNIQVVNKNSAISVVNPTSTDYVIFNGWKVNNNLIDLSTYTISENTKFVADCTYKYDVVFKVDNENYNTQLITQGTTATIPTAPTKSGYQFLGWTLNNIDVVDVSNTTINTNTIFNAKFIQQHSVIFMSENETISTQLVNNGTYATAPTITSTDYKVFNGWKLNGTIVDLSTYKVYGSATFVADITYNYDVVFKVDNENYNTQIITKGTTATLPTAPTKSGYQFLGWTLNNIDVVDVSNTTINTNTIFNAKFIQQHSVIFMSENETISTQLVRNGEYATIPTAPTKSGYIFNGWLLDNEIVDISTTPITATTIFVADFARSNYWSSITVSGVSNFNAVNLWTDGENIYYASGTEQYVLDAETYIFSPITISNNPSSFNSSYVWTDGIDTYYFFNYVFDKNTKTWVDCSITPGAMMGSTDKKNFWTDGTDLYYYSSGIGSFSYKFNMSTKSFSTANIGSSNSGTLPTGFYALRVWTDGEYAYYSDGTKQYVFDKSAKKWVAKTWYGLTNFNGGYIWRDGENTYYSNGTEQYVLDKTTSTWSVKTWDGLTDFSGGRVYVVSDTMYYLDASNNFYVFVN